MSVRHLLNSIGVSLLVFFLVGCATAEAPSAGFINPNLRSDRPDLPFQKTWVKKGVDWDKYKKLYVAPVNTSYLMKSDNWMVVERYGKGQEDAENVANYMRKTFIEAFQADPNKRFEVVEKPGSSSLILEIAVIELIPNSPALQAAGLVPIYGLAAKAVTATKPCTAAFEARIRDGVSGQILATVADRRAAKLTIVNVNDFKWYGFAEQLIKDWAKEFVEVANKRPGEVVKKSASYELKPW